MQSCSDRAPRSQKGVGVEASSRQRHALRGVIRLACGLLLVLLLQRRIPRAETGSQSNLLFAAMPVMPPQALGRGSTAFTKLERSQYQAYENRVVARKAGPAERIKQVLHVGMWPGIWKEKWIGPANLDRAELRVQGMDTYAIVAAVLLQVILSLYGSAPEPEANDPRIRYPKLQRINFELQMFLLMISALMSTYTMVTFLLCKIYTVMALGMYKDVAYETFQLATSRFRIHGFWSLIGSMVCFLFAFSLNLFTRIKGNRGLAMTAVTMSVGAVILREWLEVLALADKLIYHSHV